MAPQPAIFRRFDQWRGYDVLIPGTSDVLGPWLQLNLAQPYFNNADLAACLSYKVLAVGAASVGYPRLGRVATYSNGRLTVVSGAWAVYNEAWSGNFSGHRAAYSASDPCALSYSVPAGHDVVHVTLLVPTNVKPSVVIALDGAPLETLAYAPVVSKIDSRSYDVGVSASARELTITGTGNGGKVLAVLAVRSWASGTLADPRSATGGLVDGCTLMERVSDSQAAVANQYSLHVPNAQRSGQAWRMAIGNTWEPIIQTDHGAGAKWSSLGWPHYGGGDSTPYALVSNPLLYVDGVLIGDMTVAGLLRGTVWQGDEIVVVQDGTITGTATTMQYVHSITAYGIESSLVVVFGAGVVGASTLYGGMIAGTANVAQGLSLIRHYVREPGSETRYPTDAAATVKSPVVDVEVDGAPLVLRFESHGCSPRARTFVGFDKVYVENLLHQKTPAAGVAWCASTRVRPMVRDRRVLLPAGVTS